MSLPAEKLCELARQTELKVAALYEDTANHLTAGSEEARFFAKLATQEHMHAAWVDELQALLEPGLTFPALKIGDFHAILNTIDDVHDEVLGRGLDIPSTLEIVLHLENSIAEDFYMHFPEDLPPSVQALAARMIESSMNHARMIVEFRQHCLETGQAGVHTPEKPE